MRWGKKRKGENSPLRSRLTRAGNGSQAGASPGGRGLAGQADVRPPQPRNQNIPDPHNNKPSLQGELWRRENPLPSHLQKHVDGVGAAGKYDGAVGSLDEARMVLRHAMPDAVELPPAVAGQPYPNPPPGVKNWYQLQPPEPQVGNHLPHFKYVDWTKGKRDAGGSSGHIFFPK